LRGIEFNSTRSGKNELNHVEISNGGSNPHISGYKANISLRNSSEVSIFNSDISNSGGWGIAHPYSTLITDDTKPNTFTGNTSGDIKSN
jgi:hypothetical protein